MHPAGTIAEWELYTDDIHDPDRCHQCGGWLDEDDNGDPVCARCDGADVVVGKAEKAGEAA